MQKLDPDDRDERIKEAFTRAVRAPFKDPPRVRRQQQSTSIQITPSKDASTNSATWMVPCVVVFIIIAGIIVIALNNTPYSEAQPPYALDINSWYSTLGEVDSATYNLGPGGAIIKNCSAFQYLNHDGTKLETTCEEWYKSNSSGQVIQDTSVSQPTFIFLHQDWSYPGTPNSWEVSISTHPDNWFYEGFQDSPY